MKQKQHGFTIIELMIATTVLSVILLMVTVMITNIGNLYYKGVNQSRVQSNARSILDQMTQDLQFSSGQLTQSSPRAAVNVICIGNIRYTYAWQIKIGSPGYPHVLWRDLPGSCATDTPADLSLPTPSASGEELIGANSMVTDLTLTIASANKPATLTVGVGYGDSPPLNLSATPVNCGAGAGTQFCATANLTATVVRRVN